jgi:hypothetical protein
VRYREYSPRTRQRDRCEIVIPGSVCEREEDFSILTRQDAVRCGNEGTLRFSSVQTSTIYSRFLTWTRVVGLESERCEIRCVTSCVYNIADDLGVCFINEFIH